MVCCPAFHQHRIDCSYNNPVAAGLVYKAKDNVYGNATDCADMKEIVDSFVFWDNDMSGGAIARR